MFRFVNWIVDCLKGYSHVMGGNSVALHASLSLYSLG